jgi:hypothetical protein
MDTDAIEAIVSGVFREGKWNVAPEREPEVLNLLWKFAYGHVAEPDTFWANEKKFTVDVGFADLTGTIDRLDRITGTEDAPTLARVTDYKSSWGLPDRNFPSFQLLFYAGLVTRTHPTVEAVELTLDHVRRTDGIARFMVQRPEIESFWQSMLSRLATALERRASGAAPTGGASCTYCRWRTQCPDATLGARESIATPEDALEEADAFVRLEHSQKARKEALKAWVDEHGSVALPGLEVGYFDSSDEAKAFGDTRPIFKARKVPLIAIENFEVVAS